MNKRRRQRKTMIGGQALIEGLMMRGPEKTCMAVRKPDGEIHTELSDTKKNLIRKIPFVRGVFAMIQNLGDGYRMISKSADIAFPDAAEEELSRFDRWVNDKLGENAMKLVSGLGMVLGVALAVVLFMLVPIWLVNLLASGFAAWDTSLGGTSAFIAAINSGLQIAVVKSIIEGVIKILVFIGYLFVVTRIKDIHRVFEYHGAEHKTINCYEYGDELTVENVRRNSRFHPRCGTSFLFVVLVVSIVVFSFVSWGNPLLRAGLKLLALPLVMGISYEIIMFAGRHDNVFCRMLSAPGMGVQRLTTFEPQDDQIALAIEAFNAVLPSDGADAL